jgi:putative aldouronate transport system permease protein
LIANTVGLSVYSLVVGFPIPIIVALMLHQLASTRLRRVMQTILYAPHFISTVVVVGMLFVFLAPETGLVNHIIVWLGGQPVYFMASPNWFQTLYVFSGVWQDTGWSTIIYLAALTTVSPALHEAAMIDGASRWRRIWHIDLPGIRPMIIILLVLAMGNIMNVGFEKAYLMQTDLNLNVSEIIPTFVYKVGLLQAQYSYATAIGVFNAVINFALLIAVNQAARRLSETSLF